MTPKLIATSRTAAGSVGLPPRDDRIATVPEALARDVGEAGAGDQCHEFRGAVETNVAVIQPPQDDVGETGRQSIAGAIRNRNTSARCKYPRHLGDSALRVRVMVKRRAAQKCREGTGLERQLLAVSNDELDP